MNSHKIIGYILLFLGIVIILGVIYQTYNIFTDKVSAPLIFKVQNQKQNPSDYQQQVIQKQVTNLIPIDTVPKILNLISWSLLAGILIFGGGQIASLGIRMIL